MIKWIKPNNGVLANNDNYFQLFTDSTFVKKYIYIKQPVSSNS